MEYPFLSQVVFMIFDRMDISVVLNCSKFIRISMFIHASLPT